MKLRTLLSCFAVLLLFYNSLVLAQDEGQGKKLEEGLYKTVQEKNWQALEDMIAPEFQAVHTNKIRTRSEAIAYIKSLQFNNYQFNSFKSTQDPDGKIIVVTYTVTYSEKENQKPKSGTDTKNLSVWKEHNGKWQWVAHAVLD